jgi:nicotinamidase/pyrazinamidase
MLRFAQHDSEYSDFSTLCIVPKYHLEKFSTGGYFCRTKNRYIMKRQTIFWDVDTQFDFMQPTGKLYVPGAETIIDKVSEVRKFALDNGCSMIADIDWHSLDNEEISQSPDSKQTFPPHCMAGEPGSERVGYLGNVPIEYVEIDKMSDDSLKKLVNKNQFHIVIKKESIDAFDNPNTDRLLKLIKPKAVTVFGVALDFCVYYVLHGLAKYKSIKLVLLRDVTKGLNSRPENEILNEMQQMGVEVIRLADLSTSLKTGFKRQL